MYDDIKGYSVYTCMYVGRYTQDFGIIMSYEVQRRYIQVYKLMGPGSKGQFTKL